MQPKIINPNLTDYEWENKLRYVRIYFDTPSFDKVTKDTAATFEDKFSAIGGTFGLLTGFSIISAVEIIYFAGKIVCKLLKNVLIKKHMINKYSLKS